MIKRSALLGVLLLVAASCGHEEPPGPAAADTGVAPDSGRPDAGAPGDAGEPDAGEADAGEVDAGEPDAGPEDAGPEDAGEEDAGEADAGQTDAGPQPFSFAVFTDLHIGAGYDSYAGQEDDMTGRARAAVARTNQLVASAGIAFVFVDGDLTDSAEESEFLKVDEILGDLEVPWFPVLGNHDVWRNTKEDGNSATPAGDAAFAEVFGDRLRDPAVGEVVYPDLTVWNPERGFDCRFQNFELRYGGFTFFGLDWNSRKSAIVRGAAPEADLHDFAGGTLAWLRERLAGVPAETRGVFFIQHHGFKTPATTPDWYFTFSNDEQTALKRALLDAWPKELYWGAFAGHTHRRWKGSAFDDWPEFTQVETDAVRDNSQVTLVRVGVDGSVTVLEAP